MQHTEDCKARYASTPAIRWRAFARAVALVFFGFVTCLPQKLMGQIVQPIPDDPYEAGFPVPTPTLNPDGVPPALEGPVSELQLSEPNSPSANFETLNSTQIPLSFPVPVLAQDFESNRSNSAAPIEPTPSEAAGVLIQPLESDELNADAAIVEPTPSDFLPALQQVPVVSKTLPITPHTANTRFPLPYWQSDVPERLKAEGIAKEFSLEFLILQSLASSPFIKAAAVTPAVEREEVQKALSQFDTNQFVNSVFRDNSDPVGNTLTTGGPPRLNERIIESSAGIERVNQFGGRVEASQNVNLQDSNSVFFQPEQQATTNLRIQYTHPLMRGGGREYNRSSVLIASVDAGARAHEFQRRMQEHALRVATSYWNLYSARSQCIQIERGVNALNSIRDQLNSRAALDLMPSQLSRANAEIASLESRLIDSRVQADNAENELRALTNAPDLQWIHCSEIVPISQPSDEPIAIDLSQTLALALQNRPDLLAIQETIRTARIKQRVAENELRPTLDLITSVFVQGLDGNYNIANSFADQFATGRPSYSAGLQYSRPNGNRFARAVQRQRSLEMQRVLYELDETLLQASTQLRNSHNTMFGISQRIFAFAESAKSAATQIAQLKARWQNSAILDSVASIVILDQLLEAHIRLVTTENQWANAQAEYMIEYNRFQFLSGTILSTESEDAN